MTDQIDHASSDELTQFCRVIYRHIGIQVIEKEWPALAHILRERVDVLQMNSAQGYFIFLEQQGSEQEWTLLANRLRVGESYFFRDSGQMDLLETVILPELLQRNKTKRSLRLLSAGCSTGEEPYSLAILLDRLLPAWETWDIQILGLDIDEQALDIARKGRYTEWSFRRMPEAIRSIYFEKLGQSWQIDPLIGTLVKFRRLNLVKDILPGTQSQMTDMDLILCRNVFIYFGQDTIEGLVDIFTNALSPGGYLMTGHGELYSVPKHPLLATCAFPAAVIYQKLASEVQVPQTVSRQPAERPPYFPLQKPESRIGGPVLDRAVEKSVSQGIQKKQISRAGVQPARRVHPTDRTPHPAVLDQSGPNWQNTEPPPLTDTIVELRTMFQQGRYHQAITVGISLLEQSPQEIEIWRLLAQAHANLGQHAQAESCCARLLALDPFCASAYFLMAHIALENGEETRRIALLKKALYLDHEFVAPQLELAEIYAQKGDAEKARKMRMAACRVLGALPEDAIVDMLDDWRAGSLFEQVRELL